MNKTAIAIATASALLGASTASAHCAYHKADGHRGDGKATNLTHVRHHGIVLAGVYGTQQVAAPDIVDSAIAAGSFDTLVKAVQAAGLDGTLKGEGPFTVFAPTDTAFAKLPAGSLEALLADKKKLAQILKYHIVPGRLDARQVAGMSKLATVEGSELPVDSIKIATTDIATSNGIIHVIDEVLIPNG